MKKTQSKVLQFRNLIKKYYGSKNVPAIQKLVKKNHLDAIIKALNYTHPDAVIFVLVALSTTKNNNLFKYLSEEKQKQIIDSATTTQLKILIKNLYPDELLDLMESNQDLYKKIFICLTSQQRTKIKQIAKFESDEAGAFMNPDYISFLDSWTITEALTIFKQKYEKIESNVTFFVTSSNNVLVGQVNIQSLIFADDYTKTIDSIMDQSLISVNQRDDVENIIEIFQDYNSESLPVVDDNNCLIGVITDNDILPAIEDEVTEDIYNMYGIKPLEKSYIKSTVWSIVKSRLFWVVILMISATLTSIVINQFEVLGKNLLQSLSTVLLVPIIPVITGTSGNTGSQSVATVIRALAVGEVTPKEYRRVMFKEFKVGVILGGLLAIFNLVRLAIYFAIPAFRDVPSSDLHGHDPYGVAMIAAAASSIALWIAIILSKIIGSLLPMIATKLNLDPTVMSTPLIATTIDVCSTSILFGVGIGCLYLVTV